MPFPQNLLPKVLCDPVHFFVHEDSFWGQNIVIIAIVRYCVTCVTVIGEPCNRLLFNLIEDLIHTGALLMVTQFCPSKKKAEPLSKKC